MRKILIALAVLVTLAVAGTALTAFANQRDVAQSVKLADIKMNMSNPQLNRIWMTCNYCVGTGRCSVCAGIGNTLIPGPNGQLITQPCPACVGTTRC